MTVIQSDTILFDVILIPKLQLLLELLLPQREKTKYHTTQIFSFSHSISFAKIVDKDNVDCCAPQITKIGIIRESCGRWNSSGVLVLARTFGHGCYKVIVDIDVGYKYV